MPPPSATDYHEAVDLQPVKIVQSKNGTANLFDSLQPEEHEKHDLVLRVFRCLIADLCQQFNGGHPGYVWPLSGVGVTGQ
jgi:dihydroxyacetone synthase